MIAAELGAFLAARAAGLPPSPGIEAGVQVAAVCDAIFQSARDGRRIEVPT